MATDTQNAYIILCDTLHRTQKLSKCDHDFFTFPWILLLGIVIGLLPEFIALSLDGHLAACIAVMILVCVITVAVHKTDFKIHVCEHCSELYMKGIAANPRTVRTKHRILGLSYDTEINAEKYDVYKVNGGIRKLYTPLIAIVRNEHRITYDKIGVSRSMPYP